MPGKPDDLAALGAALRHYRDRARITQEELAERSGLHVTYIGGAERGERNLSYRSLARILEALGVSWAAFGRDLDARVRR